MPVLVVERHFVCRKIGMLLDQILLYNDRMILSSHENSCFFIQAYIIFVPINNDSKHLLVIFEGSIFVIQDAWLIEIPVLSDLKVEFFLPERDAEKRIRR